MPHFDQHCCTCDWVADIYAKPHEHPPCPKCGGKTERIYLGQSHSVRQDAFIGGLTLENLGHEPVTVYSRSELKRIMHERGLQEFVRHTGSKGSDKSPHTTRWVAMDQYTLDAAKALLERVDKEPARQETESERYWRVTGQAPITVGDVKAALGL